MKQLDTANEESAYEVRLPLYEKPERAQRQQQPETTAPNMKLKPARVSWANEDQLRFVLREGRKRQIRRMCELVGLFVTGLKRVRSGNIPLGGLPVGKWRYLRPDEKF